MAIAGFALFLLGIILIIVAPINKRKNARCSAETQGVLQEIRRREHGHTYLYSYSVDGVDYQLKSTICSKEPNNTGDTCTIWYDPARPKDAQPFRYESGKVYRIILLIGIALFLLGIVLTCIGLAH